MTTPASSAPVDAGLVASLRGLDRNGRLLFTTRVLRMFAYGFLAVVLVLYLAGLGLDALTIGAILTLTLVGDTVVSLWLTTNADRIGRRRVLVAGSLLMTAAGLVFAVTSWVPLLILAATIGVISPTGNEVGPFLAVEQAALSQATPDARRTPTFAWYNLAGYVATAVGALAAGFLTQALLAVGLVAVDAYRVIVVGYAVVGLLMAAVFWRVGAAVEVPAAEL
ncbi:MAG TPA: MFS transporter, partial [Verrucomicrobiae bacterium]|nr:MFS transporter [Verrucomicrobiae bacterium]